MLMNGKSCLIPLLIFSDEIMTVLTDNLTPAPNIRSTRATREFQYTRYLAYSDALKNSFFPRTIPVWNSLPSSVVSSKTPEEFKALI